MTNKVWVAVLPSVGNMAVVDDDNKQYHVFTQVNLASFLFSGFCSVTMFNLMNPLVTVWLGSQYTVSTATAFAIAFNMYLFLTILPFQTFRDANGLFVQGKYRPVIMSIINISLSLALVKPCGLFGVLFATPISRLVTQTWFDPFVVYKHVFKKSPMPYYKEFIMHSIISLGSGVAIWFILEWMQIGGGLVRLMVGSVMCVVLLPLLYFFLFRKNEQFTQLIHYSKRMINRILKRNR